MMMSDFPKELKFTVAAGPAWFTVTFYIGAGYLNADCDCPAGKYGNFCQHRLKLLRGDGSEIVGDKFNELEMVTKNLPGTRLETALIEFEALANQVTDLRAKGPSARLDEVEEKFKEARKKLSMMMMA